MDSGYWISYIIQMCIMCLEVSGQTGNDVFVKIQSQGNGYDPST